MVRVVLHQFYSTLPFINQEVLMTCDMSIAQEGQGAVHDDR